MCAAKGGKPIVKCDFVGQVNHIESQAPLVTIAVEQVIIAHRKVEQAARGDSLWMMIVVFRSRCRDAQERRPKLGGEARTRQGLNQSCAYPVAGEPCLHLLIGGQGRAVHSVEKANRWQAVERGRSDSAGCSIRVVAPESIRPLGHCHTASQTRTTARASKADIQDGWFRLRTRHDRCERHRLRRAR